MPEPLLELRSVTKTYPGVTALDDVSLSLNKGEVLGLIGENGAGKSTLMKILGGIVAPTAGTIELDGVSHDRLTVPAATAAGIAFVHQELNLFDNLSVGANVYIGREPRYGGPLNLIDTRALNAKVAPLLDRLGLDISPSTPLAELSLAQCQLVEIAKALSLDARVIIMDEPTSSLTLKETDRLLEVIADLRADGVSIIYISHRLDEVKSCADRVVALRDGRRVGELVGEQITHDAMIRLMIGRALKAVYLPPKVAPKDSGVVIDRLVTRARPDKEVSFAFRRGEIVGLAGLIGSGRTELAHAIFGIDPPLSGRVLLDGEPVVARVASDAIAKGIYLAPEDRKRAGLLLDLPVDQNITLADLASYARHGLPDRAAEARAARQQCESLSIKTPSTATHAVNLSGGNQQKVVLGKWLSMRPNAVIFDEPTRGIDVGAKSEIYAIMRALADAGVAILMISSDMEEVIGVSDRIAVMHEGRISGMLERPDFSEHNVMLLAVGATTEERTRENA
ncbi:sugar ABC transporter ATP-binding protein [Acuticoccus kandeliae]|uniref:sugar ABC transporter ATP-binding protein n=1 Tax=Acuticoccus kandeliae TaxID=2073160 RepID=UPI000D3EDD0D|nr:sugar ABC transporter ATP-binding protein [Acuticoccus kandeliae]